MNETISNLDTLEASLMAEIASAADEQTIEAVRVAALGKKGSVSELLKTLGSMTPEERQVKGPAINGLKARVTEALGARKAELKDVAITARLAAEKVDVTLSVRQSPAERLGDSGFQPVDCRPLHLPLFRRHRTKRLQELRNRALLAERGDAHRLDRRLVGSRCDLGHQGIFECFHFAHVPDPLGEAGSKKNPRQPCQRGFPKSEFRKLGKRWLKLQRFQKRSAWCP